MASGDLPEQRQQRREHVVGGETAALGREVDERLDRHAGAGPRGQARPAIPCPLAEFELATRDVRERLGQPDTRRDRDGGGDARLLGRRIDRGEVQQHVREVAQRLGAAGDGTGRGAAEAHVGEVREEAAGVLEAGRGPEGVERKGVLDQRPGGGLEAAPVEEVEAPDVERSARDCARAGAGSAGSAGWRSPRADRSAAAATSSEPQAIAAARSARASVASRNRRAVSA